MKYVTITEFFNNPREFYIENSKVNRNLIQSISRARGIKNHADINDASHFGAIYMSSNTGAGIHYTAPRHINSILLSVFLRRRGK